MNLIIGAGQVFRNYYLPNINNKSNYFVFDINNISDKKGFIYISDENKLLEEKYDIIYVLTPPESHFYYFQLLNDKCSAFYIEKPVFLDNEEYKVSRKLNNRVTVLGGYSRRFFNNYTEFKDLILKSELKSTISQVNISEGYNYKWNSVHLESITNDELSHLIDSFLYILNLHNSKIDFKINTVRGDDKTYIDIDLIINQIPINIKFSRVEELINQFNFINYDGDVYSLNSNLNGGISSIISNTYKELKMNSNKQSSVSVFKEILNFVESKHYLHEDVKSLTKFNNTISILEDIKKKIQ